MTIEEIIKEAFSQGWNASHECATDFDYEYALKNCLLELDSDVKKLNISDVIKSVCLDSEYAIETVCVRYNNDGSCRPCGFCKQTLITKK